MDYRTCKKESCTEDPPAIKCNQEVTTNAWMHHRMFWQQMVYSYPLTFILYRRYQSTFWPDKVWLMDTVSSPPRPEWCHLSFDPSIDERRCAFAGALKLMHEVMIQWLCGWAKVLSIKFCRWVHEEKTCTQQAIVYSQGLVSMYK